MMVGHSMSRYAVLLLSTFTLSQCVAPPPANVPAGPLKGPLLELVESVPLETGWDQPQVRDTPQVWLEMIRKARQTIELGQFYFANKPGSRLEPIIAELIRAAKRGVRVRVLAEKIFLRYSRPTLERLARQENIETVIFDIKGITGGILHAKYFIVDGREVFIGSQNFDWRALEHIHEIGLRIRCRATALTLLRIFEADWRIMKGGQGADQAPGPDRDGDGLPDAVDPRPDVPTWAPHPRGEPTLLYLVASPPALNPPGVPAAAERLIKLIDKARQSIKVQLLTYSTTTHSRKQWHDVDRALRRAAARGVKVKLNISHWNTRQPNIRHIQDLSRTPNIQIKLNTIPQWSGGFVPFARVDHSKYMIVDEDIGWVGTSNWSGGYFTESRNVEVIFRHREVVKQLNKIFCWGWDSAYAADLDPAGSYTPPRRK